MCESLKGMSERSEAVLLNYQGRQIFGMRIERYLQNMELVSDQNVNLLGKE